MNGPFAVKMEEVLVTFLLRQFYIGKNGFVVLSDTAELLYKASNEFSKEHDRGVLWNDKDININWEIDFEPILSDKDKIQPTLKEINLEELK